MDNSAWTDVDPQPGDFDHDLATIDPRFVEIHRGDANATGSGGAVRRTGDAGWVKSGSTGASAGGGGGAFSAIGRAW